MTAPPVVTVTVPVPLVDAAIPMLPPETVLPVATSTLPPDDCARMPAAVTPAMLPPLVTLMLPAPMAWARTPIVTGRWMAPDPPMLIVPVVEAALDAAAAGRGEVDVRW